jgi:CNT family concentrative nucleoside transporter
MLIAFIALVHLSNAFIGVAGHWLAMTGMKLDSIGLDLNHLTLQTILGACLSPVAVILGVPFADAPLVGRLLGEKIIINEFLAFSELSTILKDPLHTQTLSAHGETIATFALCGFANLSSIAMQIGGIGEIAPSRREDLARLGVKALICGTMASYLSATVAGLLS